VIDVQDSSFNVSYVADAQASRGYVVHVYKDADLVQVINTTSNNIIVNNVEPYSQEYFVSVAFRTDESTSQFSNQVSSMTSNITSVDADKISISWTPYAAANLYIITVQFENRVEVTLAENPITQTGTDLVISPLEPGITYFIEVAAVNADASQVRLFQRVQLQVLQRQSSTDRSQQPKTQPQPLYGQRSVPSPTKPPCRKL